MNAMLKCPTNAYFKLPIDIAAMRAEKPSIKAMYAVENFQAKVKQMLFTHNLGHAVMRYLGYLKGYRYI
jgi:mannitol-1-phosphate/altronate dehydrogenase